MNWQAVSDQRSAVSPVLAGARFQREQAAPGHEVLIFPLIFHLISSCCLGAGGD
jgi:hypothetical protein